MIIQCPACQFERNVNINKIPPTAQLATCPKCQHKFRFREHIVDDLPHAKRGEAEPAQHTTQSVVSKEVTQNEPPSLAHTSEAHLSSPAPVANTPQTGPQPSMESSPLRMAEDRESDSDTPSAHISSLSAAIHPEPLEMATETITSEKVPALSKTDSISAAPEDSLSIATNSSQSYPKEASGEGATFEPALDMSRTTPADPSVLHEHAAHPPATLLSDEAEKAYESTSSHVEAEAEKDVPSETSAPEEHKDIWDAIAALGGGESTVTPNQTPTISISSSIPWEHPDTRGTAGAFFRSLFTILISPATAFSTLTSQNTTFYPLIFFIVASLAGLFFQQTWSVLLQSVELSSLPAGIQTIASFTLLPFSRHSLIAAAGIGLPATLFGLALLYHIPLRLLKGRRASFRLTLRVIAYSGAASILAIIPAFGPLLALLWFYILTGIGVRSAHALSWQQTIIVLLPVYLCLILLTGGLFQIVPLPLPA